MKKIKQIPVFDRPREKLISHGAEVLSDTELVAILIGSGVKGKSVLSVAKSVLKVLDKNGDGLDVETLLEINGIGMAKASQISAAVEFSRRRYFRESKPIKKAADVIPYISHIASEKQENFVCLSLNGANEILGNRLITIGLLNSTQIHPREVFADTISDRAASVILAHNHPSGQLKPSSEDIAVTKQMTDAGTILGINVLDHIIITSKGHFSFKEEGLI